MLYIMEIDRKIMAIANNPVIRTPDETVSKGLGWEKKTIPNLSESIPITAFPANTPAIMIPKMINITTLTFSGENLMSMGSSIDRIIRKS